MNVVATESFSSESVWRWFTTIDLECIRTISHDPTHNSMKLLRNDSLSGTGCPLTSEDVRLSDQDILPFPGHHNISDVPSRHSLNSRDSRNHFPVPSSRFCMNSF